MLDASNLRRLLVVDPCDDCRRLLPGLREAGWAVDSCALETARERAATSACCACGRSTWSGRRR